MVWLGIFFVSGLLSNIFFKKELNATINYPFFVVNLNPFIFAILYSIPYLFHRHRLKRKGEASDFPIKKMQILSCFYAISNVIELTSADNMGRTSGPLMLVLSQGVIPITVTLSYFLLKKKYSKIQILGATVVIVGVTVALIPEIEIVSRNSQESFKVVMWQLIYFSKNFPFSLENIGKEYLFSGHVISVLFVAFWEQVLTLPVSLPLSMLYFPIMGISTSEIPGYYRAAFRCVLGNDTFPTDRCGSAYTDVILFNLSASIWGISMIGVIRHGSANLLFIANGLLLPLSALMFSSNILMGSDVTPFSAYYVIGLVIVAIGMGTYSYGDRKQEDRVIGGSEK